MTREKADKRTRQILFALYVLIIVIEAALAAYASSHNAIDLLTVGFPDAMMVLLLADIPLFIFIAIIANAVKEIVLYYNSYNKNTKALRWIIVSTLLVAVTVTFFTLTSNATDVTLNTVFYYGTIISAVATVISFVIYGRMAKK